MSKIIVQLDHHVKRQLRKLKRKTKDPGFALRCQIILMAHKKEGHAAIAQALDCSLSWIGRVIKRFCSDGVAGLVDHREDNGDIKLGEHFLSTLYELVDESPQQNGFPRPTWTRELLVIVMFRKTGVKIHPATMSRALAKIGARLGRPRPTVGCPWKRRRKNKRLAMIRKMLATLPKNHVAVYLDEVDIHLNPKIGSDWMNRGTQKLVMTPGNNVKQYLCGALNATTGMLTWVKGERKNSLLFIDMLAQLRKDYPEVKVIHVILDNFKIHDSKASRAAVASHGGKIVLHFLPPYCPQHNRIERVWLDVHANVTRNHTCKKMTDLMRRVNNYLIRRNHQLPSKSRKAA